MVQQQQEQAAGGLPRAPAALRQRVEPKTFFANERTFLQVRQGGLHVYW
jgi:hypothetical protein